MNDTETIINRLKEASYSTSNEMLAKALNISSGAVISTWKKRNKIPYQQCVEYSLKNDKISLDWLIFGTGNMLRAEVLDPNEFPPKPFDSDLMQKIITALETMIKYNTTDRDISIGTRLPKLKVLTPADKSATIIKIYKHFEHLRTPKYAELEKIIRLIV